MGGAVFSLAAGLMPRIVGAVGGREAFLDAWQAETDRVQPEQYRAYLRKGENPDGLVSLDRLENAWNRH